LPDSCFRLTIAAVATLKNVPDLKQRLVSAAPVEDDSSFELKLRPQRLAEFIGQPKVKENLAVAIEAARSRGEALDHVLLYGPPGLGKTTLATIIANELGVAFQQTSGPTLQIKGDLTAILTFATSRFCLLMKFTGCNRRSKKFFTLPLRTTSSTSSSGKARRRGPTPWT
jgi:predicted AAA+ superfamily ATPase